VRIDPWVVRQSLTYDYHPMELSHVQCFGCLSSSLWHTEGMNVESRQVLESALALPEADRAAIAASLIESLEPPHENGEDVDAAWAAEIKRRIDSIDRGEEQLIPWGDVMRDMRQSPRE